MAKPTRLTAVLLLLSLPIMGKCEPHYAGGDYRGDLIQLGARYLNPRLSRFTTPDPAKQFFSGYQYSAGTPVTLADPSGAMLPELEGSIERAISDLESEHAVVTESTQQVQSAAHVNTEKSQSIIRRPTRQAPPPPTPPKLQAALAGLNTAEEELNLVDYQIRVARAQRERVIPGIRGVFGRLRLSAKLIDLRAQRGELTYKREYYSLRVQEEHASHIKTLRELQRRPMYRRIVRNEHSGQWELLPGRAPVMETLDANLLFDQLQVFPSPAERSLDEQQKIDRVQAWLATTQKR